MFRRGTRRWLLAIVVGWLWLAAGCSSDDAGAEAVDGLGDSEIDPEPFVAVEGGTLPADVEPLLQAAAQAAEDAADQIDSPNSDLDRAVIEARLKAGTAVFSEAGEPLIRPRSTVGAAVVPGDGDEVCDLATMIELYQADPDAAAASAEIQGIRVDDLATFLRSLTAGYLIDDFPVINHRYRDGVAVPMPTTLAAGTAVMVDDDGLPRVRCHRASPLVPTRVELGDRIVAAAAFADRVHEADIAAEVPAERQDSIDGLFTNEPAQALGPPDRSAVSLGDDPDAGSCRYRIVLEFVDNRLIDGPGDDLQIVELGRSESTYVSVGITADQLRPVGEIKGGTTSIDLSPIAADGDRFAFIQLCDGPDVASEVPGSDIDAVAALSSVDG